MNHDQLTSIRDTTLAFATAAKSILTWQWDSRFFAALSQFDKQDEPAVSACLNDAFGAPWTIDNLNNASEIVLIISDVIGGLRPGQRLYTTSPERTPILFVAYWPWGNGDTISLRLVPTAQDVSGDEMVELVSAFRRWMNI